MECTGGWHWWSFSSGWLGDQNGCWHASVKLRNCLCHLSLWNMCFLPLNVHWGLAQGCPCLCFHTAVHADRVVLSISDGWLKPLWTCPSHGDLWIMESFPCFQSNARAVAEHSVAMPAPQTGALYLEFMLFFSSINLLKCSFLTCKLLNFLNSFLSYFRVLFFETRAHLLVFFWNCSASGERMFGSVTEHRCSSGAVCAQYS